MTTRVRRVFKYIGLCIAIALLLIWIVSAFMTVQWITTGRMIAIGHGALYVTWCPVTPDKGWVIEIIRWFPGLQFWRPERFYLQTTGTTCLVIAPFWIPAVIAALPAIYLIWRDRRIQPGHCRKCGYNLTGNVSGVCPECGTEVTTS